MFIQGTREILGKDYFEDYPEWPYATEGETVHGISYPGDHGLTQVISPIVLDERFIKLYSGYMGFDNPL